MALATSRVSSPPSNMVSSSVKGSSKVTSRELRAKRRLSYADSGPIATTRRKVSLTDAVYYNNNNNNTGTNNIYFSHHIHSNHQEATPPETNGDDSLSPIPCPQQMGVTLECSAPPPKSTTGGVGVVPVPAPVSAKTRSKSVTFDISNNKEYEASPLLTPKYEDEDDEDDFGEFASKSSTSEIVSEHDINNSGREMTICDDLNRNSDYSALCATLEMLHNKESQIHSEMTQLTNLKATLEHMNKSSLISFYLRLLQGQVHLPTPSKIPKAPVVQWGKYGLSDKVGDCLKGTMNLKEKMDQGLKVFNSPSNDQFSFENF